jgi:glutamate synthase (NADPH) large chain
MKISAQGLYDPRFEHDACGVGFVVNIKGKKSHDIVKKGLQTLVNLRHRGACGCEENTGDGAGILIQIPHEFFKEVCAKKQIALPEPGEYGVGMVFMPPDQVKRRGMERMCEEMIQAEGQRVLGWRTVPTNNASIGETAKSQEPVIRQVFVGRGQDVTTREEFARKLYVIRRRTTKSIVYSGVLGSDFFYYSSLSVNTITYKGMLLPEQVQEYYPDLSHPKMSSALALVHSRFSTNTFPSWDRSHPYRMVAHNGEINTLRGNINWMHARQATFKSHLFNDLDKIRPIILTDGSDSSMFDNFFEFLVLSGRSMPQTAMMMIPEPWSNHESMSDEKKAFYEYHSCLMEPWDGPASIAFTDGTQIGAVLDRNGLRPSRYYVTKDDLVIMASEVGVIEVEPENVLQKGRLQPGKMFLIDTKEGRIVSDEEIKQKIVTEKPYRQWLNENMIRLEDLPEIPVVNQTSEYSITTCQKAFGYTQEDLKMIVLPMAKNGIEPLGSMGNDAPLAVLSNKPQLLYGYFKQLFAQVTNPPVDAIREEIVTSTDTMIGSEGNLLDPKPESCRMIKLKYPILTNEELEKLRRISQPGFKAQTLPIIYDVQEGGKGIEKALSGLFESASRLIAEGVNILILSDKNLTTKEKAAIPALLAVSGLHHHLIREGTRTKVGIILESGEPREVHHFALLVGYGVGAINPYLAFATIDELINNGHLTGIDHKDAAKNYVKASVKGIVKTMSKMGISAIQSYRGAQIFEAVGLNSEVIDKHFTWTPSRVEGISLDGIAKEVQMRHERAFPKRSIGDNTLDPGGNLKWRREGEFHLFNPVTIHSLQKACREENFSIFKEYSEAVNNQSKNLCTLRSLLEMKYAETPVPLEEVESVESIMKRFKTGAMSYGSISKEAHETLAIAMNRIGGKSNTGEGGEDPERFKPEPNGDSKCSAIKQVASGRFGVTSHYLVNAKELQIKMAQGAKPGEGGQLPGSKVYPWVAKTRHSTPGVGLISPPPHHDIYSIEDLAELIHDLKNANRHARISVKLVSEVGVGTVAAGVAKAHADVVLISGYDGGTGASPISSIKHAGMPWELGLSEAHQTLLINNLRSRIVVEVDGQLKTGRDVAIAAMLGGEEFGFATAPLVVMGCIMLRCCHQNSCSVGVATQNPELRKKFTGKPEHVINFMRFIAEELREYMSKLGFRTIDEMVGRTDRLEMQKAVDHWKAKGLDLSKILYQPEVGENIGRYCQISQNHGIENSIDLKVLLKICDGALKRGEKLHTTLPIENTNRVVGTILGSEVTKRYGAAGLPDNTIHLHFKGSAGQSLGAFVPRGITIELEGDANDYTGKGLCGGKIIVYPPIGSSFVPEENIIIGNVAFYGATSGEAYIRGMAGERFCVRNSGLSAVVESVGDHGCEYMTGGRVVVLGKTGRNFAAGMSGGIAYVLDMEGDFHTRCNTQMVYLERLEELEEIEDVRQMIVWHHNYTKSTKAKHLLSLWDDILPKFVKVMPKDYKRIMETMKRVKAMGLDGDEAIMTAFEENTRDISRITGN